MPELCQIICFQFNHSKVDIYFLFLCTFKKVVKEVCSLDFLLSFVIFALRKLPAEYILLTTYRKEKIGKLLSYCITYLEDEYERVTSHQSTDHK